MHYPIHFSCVPLLMETSFVKPAIVKYQIEGSDVTREYRIDAAIILTRDLMESEEHLLTGLLALGLVDDHATVLDPPETVGASRKS